jgi:beta-galactosidase
MTDRVLPLDRRTVLSLTAGGLVTPYAGVAWAAPALRPQSLSSVTRDQSFDHGWLFLRGEGQGLEAVETNDSAWRAVDLPHDWSIEDVPGGQPPTQIGPFDKKAVGGTDTGFTLGGEGWYRKHFRVDRLPVQTRVEVLFDGVYSECDVWLNGKRLGTNLYGYAPFAFDLTPALDRAGDNVLAVRVRNIGKNSRWYTGSGIYRSVTLDVIPEQTRLARWGVAAWTRSIANGVATVDVTTAIEAPDATTRLVTRLHDAQGKIVAQASDRVSASLRQSLRVPSPHLWSPSSPYLYTLETVLERDGKSVDRIVQQYGVRIISMDAKRGLLINGERTIIRGGCLHHDNGLLGACAYPDADERRIRLIKARGYNAIRSSHNPSARGFREACDRLGMLLFEEIFDMWHAPKQADDFARHFRSHWEKPVTAMVMSARNSPSVIMWGIGNEISERSTSEGVKWSWTLSNAVRRLDSTRPVTAALNGVLGPLIKPSDKTALPGHAGETDNASTAFLDIAGYNYRLAEIERDHGEFPNRVIYGSETYPKEAQDYAVLAEKAPYMLGEFVWTAMDYLGEAGLGATANVSAGGAAFFFPGWPWVVSWCGDLDLIGNQKASSFYRDVVWGVSKLEMAVQRPVPDGKVPYISAWGWYDELQSWTWPEAEGKPFTVRVYTTGDRVELLLNGKKVAEKEIGAVDKLKVELTIPYSPGRLEAVAYTGEREIACRGLETVGQPASLRLRRELRSVGSARHNLAFIAIDIVDEHGRRVPEDGRKVEIAISGPAELAAFGSANALATGSFKSNEAQVYRGAALAILRATGRKGRVTILARAPGVKGASTTVTLN